MKKNISNIYQNLSISLMTVLAITFLACNNSTNQTPSENDSLSAEDVAEEEVQENAIIGERAFFQAHGNVKAIETVSGCQFYPNYDLPEVITFDENGRPYKSSGGAMVYNEQLKREIPEGWECKKIVELCTFNRTSLTTRILPDKMLYLGTSNLTRNAITELQELTSDDIIPSRARRLVQNLTILYSSVRPNLCHYGIMINPDSKLVVSTGFITIDVNNRDILSPFALYLWLTTERNTQYLHNIAVNSVSAYPSITSSDIEQMLLPIPDSGVVMKNFNLQLLDIYNKIDANDKEINTLQNLQTKLLPLLMTGQAMLK